MTSVVMPILLSAQLASAQALPARVVADVEQAQRFVVLGDVKASRAAVERAVEGRTAAERADIQVAVADLLARSTDKAAIEEAERLYALSLDSARQTFTLDRRLRTENNYAAVLMQTGRAGDARQRLESIRDQMNKQPRAVRARYLFNYAKAVGETGDHTTALKIYDEALALGPEFEDTAMAASRLALTSPSESIGIPATVSLVDRMIATRQFDVAEQHLLKSSEQPRWFGHP
jgi:tetratricopeptide (TPR) repeat protein